MTIANTKEPELSPGSETAAMEAAESKLNGAKRKLHILYSHRIQSRDGMSVHVEELVTALRAAGHEVLVTGPGFYSRSSFGGESRIVSLLRRFLPVIMLDLGELAYNVPAYFRLLKACKAFEPDLLYERNNLYFFAGTIVARQKRLPFYLEVNSPLSAERVCEGTVSLRRLARLLERFVWTSADRIFVVTNVLKQTIVELGVRPERVMVVPNATRLERYSCGTRSADEAKPTKLGFVGFVRDWHGLDSVIHAMAVDARLARTELIIAGDGPARNGLEVLAKRLGVAGRVRFMGVVEYSKIPATVAGFDIALQPKALCYSSPLKIFDYMAAGCPIIAPDQPNIREVLTHNRTAFLFDPDAPEALRSAICQLIDNPALCKAIGNEARLELIYRDYTWTGNARRIASHAQADVAEARRRGLSRSRRLLAAWKT